ncbi:MAG: GH92 family glycosyl hydrolase, partial [Candidatus Aminicenantes bacterium]|nr:GH92 family glycosyl hydrolase [Candidatus Aminicenantes bacterium]
MSENWRFWLFLIMIPVLLCMGCTSDPDCLADRVNTLVGTDTDYALSCGNIFPAVAPPLAMTSWTPQTGTGRIIYQFQNGSIQGFRGTHQSSVWLGDYGSLTIMPMTGKLMINPKDRASKFNHEQEVAKPYFYETVLSDYQIQVRLTATERCGFFQFRFPRSSEAYIILEPSSGKGTIRIIPEENKVTGINVDGGDGNPKNFGCYFVACFDKPFHSWGTYGNKSIRYFSRGGKGQSFGGSFVRFRTRQNESIKVKIATSFMSYRQARLNLQREIPGWDFELIKSKGKAVWNRELERLEIRGGTLEQKMTFYTALCRSLRFPRKIHEPDLAGKPYHYSPYDGEIHEGVLISDTGFWDTYRAQFPLLVLIKPETANEIVKGLLNAYREGGWLPKWPSPGYRNVMTGTPADMIIADALGKGIRQYDLTKAYQAMLKNATRVGDHGFEGRVGIQDYSWLGYVPADRVPLAASRTLEFAYNDFAVAQMARQAGRAGDFERLIKRAENYKLIYDPATGFMRSKDSRGNWIEPFDPLEWGNGFCEGNAWHYLWSIQHDIPGLIELMGGDKEFIDKLDRLLSQPSVIRPGSYEVVIHEMREMQKIGMGQYAHNNEPLHHVLYLYSYAGQPWKTQMWVRKVMTELYSPTPDGLCGDDDTGQLSAWYVFSA